jgi:hypothetical protein
VAENRVVHGEWTHGLTVLTYNGASREWLGCEMAFIYQISMLSHS